MTQAKKVSPSFDAYSFEEGFLAALEIDRKERTVLLEFNAVPLRPGHPDFSQARLRENRRKGLIYSNEDARNVDLRFSGCSFRDVSIDAGGKPFNGRKELQLNNAIERFLPVLQPSGGGNVDLKAEEILLSISYERVEISETRPLDSP